MTVRVALNCSIACALIISALALSASDAGPSSDPLLAGFKNPPASARPRVWWHWMDGNVTEDGIQRDLQWMKRVGIGGVQNFDAAFYTPKIVESPITYLSADWQKTFRYAVETADKLGLEFSIAGSPGWSESGGPWVKPQQAMKKLTWSETILKGGRPFSGKLPQPPGTTGPYLNVPIDGDGVVTQPNVDYYTDVALIAYRRPATDRTMSELGAVATASSNAEIGTLLWDDDFNGGITVPYGENGNDAWIQVALNKPETVRSISLTMPSARAGKYGDLSPDPIAILESSNDGRNFSRVEAIMQSNAIDETVSFDPVTARYFRLVLPTPKPVVSMIGNFGATPRTTHQVSEFVLHTSAHVDHVESKAGFVVPRSGEIPQKLFAAAAEATIAKSQIINLTSKMTADGGLEWTPPEGDWVVMRIGYSLLGVKNSPASSAGTGLEVDKLDGADVRSYLSSYLGEYAAILPKSLLGHRGLQGMVNDSWEAGAQNWTPNFPAEFKRRRGYDLWPWLPAITGKVIGSPELTDAFLWDYRRTLGELVIENHYATIAQELRRRGMIHYAESHESGRALIGDGMDVKRFSTVPMSAIWAAGIPQEGADADIRESASVAHIYGQNLVAAESFTAIGNTFAFVPQMLKPTADRALAAGLNRFVIHTSVHQPLNEPGPGITLGPFGQWFTRHETWAEQSRAWLDYLARSSYLLQQGHFVADVLYFYGEDSNITALYGKQLPTVPDGYNFDFANAHVLTMVSVANGQLRTNSGMRYRLLALDPRTQRMSLDSLRRIRTLVQNGAVVAGKKPEMSPSLADDAVQFKKLADELWGTASDANGRAVGKGRVFDSTDLAAVLTAMKVAPDFTYKKNAADSRLQFVHRKLADGEIYFVSNRVSRSESVEASFHVSGKAPEIWHADTGRTEPASYRIVGDRTLVTLMLEPDDAQFIVFRRTTQQQQLVLPNVHQEIVSALTGSWQVQFDTAQGAPAQTNFNDLSSWSVNSDSGIRYYSGTARYQRTIDVQPSWLEKGSRVELDLGDVKNIAEVKINGKVLATLWKAPFRIDVTEAVKQGANELEVAVTNTWVNRLIGDQQVGAKRYASTTFNPYKADSPLLAAGLLGPVTLIKVESAQE